MKIKKYLIVLSVFLAFLGMIYTYTQYNLTRYSVYYANHIPRKEGAQPELVMAVENKNLIDKPDTD